MTAVSSLLVALITVAPHTARAAGVVNGDFETGDFSGWSIGSDGGTGHPGDFAVVQSGGDHVGQVKADYYAISGDVTSAQETQVFIANTLSADLDLTLPIGEPYLLEFTWELTGEDGGAQGSEVFCAALTKGSGEQYGGDGEPGYILAPISGYGSHTLSVILDPATFNNASGWMLEIQLGLGVDPGSFQPNGLGSTLQIDDVQLIPAPEPSELTLLAFGLLGLCALHWRIARRQRPATRQRCAAGWQTTLALLIPLCLLLPHPSVARASAWTILVNTTEPPTRKSFDVVNKWLVSHVTATRPASSSPGSRLRLVISDSSLRVVNHDGLTGDAESYFDLPALAVDEKTTVRVAFPWVRAPLAYVARLEELPSPLQPLQILSGPSLAMNPNNSAPLAGLITATTNIPARVTLDVFSASHSYSVELPEYNTSHSFHLLGMRSATTYSVGVTFTDADENVLIAAPVIQPTTPPLPADFPVINVLASQPASMEAGFTLIDRFSRDTGEAGASYTIIVDEEGEVVWYSTEGGSNSKQLANGKVRYGYTYNEFDMLGEVLTYPLQPTVGDLHHDLYETEHGTFLSLTQESFVENNYPGSETDPNAPTTIADLEDNPVVEYRPDRTLLNLWATRDLLDSTRIGFYSTNRCASTYGCDWVHSNAVYHDPRDDSILVSVRHQDAVISFDRISGRLNWILGPHANWTSAHTPFLLTPIGPLEWQYHQHAMMTTPTGTVLMFDNHNVGHSPFDSLPATPDSELESRAVEFFIDKDTMEVSQVWEYRPAYEDRLFSLFISDADRLLNGNTLINFGGVTFEGGVDSPGLGKGSRHTHVVEVDGASPANVVFEIELYAPIGPSGGRITSYRAERIPSLYPRTH